MQTFQKPLTHAEEAIILRQLKEGSAEEQKRAKDILIEHNLRLVAHIARKYQSCDVEQEDLISIGCIGLIKALDTFDVEKGRLATYACRCIDNELLMLLRSRRKSSREVSLFEPIGQDKEGNEICLVDVIEQEQPDVVERLELERNVARLGDALRNALTPRERQIIRLRYGLGGRGSLTQNEIGAMLGISRSYVSRIEKKALRKLYQDLSENKN